MKYPGVDIIRLCAALMVVAYHLGHDASGYTWAHWGWVGVPVFFVISGFVIAMSAESKTAAEFVRGRAIRLYPAAWVAATITLIVVGASGGEYLRSITLFPVGPWVDDVYWTLAVEIVFYSLVAIGVWRGVSLRKLALGLGLYSAAFWALKAANSAVGLVDLSAIEDYEGFLLLLHDGVFFAIGMLLWQKRYSLMTLFVAVGIVAVFARSQAISEQGAIVAPLVWLAATVAVVLSAKLGGSWSARTIGLMTYPLYLIHNEVGRVAVDHSGFAFGVVAVLLLAAAIMQAEQGIKWILLKWSGPAFRRARRWYRRESAVPQR